MSPAKTSESSDCGTAVLRDSFDAESSFVVPQDSIKKRKRRAESVEVKNLFGNI